MLADRLDQTSRDLSTAKEELAAEDISDALVAEELEDTSTTDPGTSERGRLRQLPELSFSDLAALPTLAASYLSFEGMPASAVEMVDGDSLRFTLPPLG